MLIDISDILQICVHELGRTYVKFAKALHLTIPSIGKQFACHIQLARYI